MPRIVAATYEHAFVVARDTRAADAAEVFASSGHSPLIATLHSVNESILCWAALDDEGVPFTIFGVGHYIDDVGSPWLLATDRMYAHRTFFLRNTRPIIDEMHAEYPILLNYVDARHNDAMRWLLFGGFKFDKFIPHHGYERRPFLRFTKVNHV